MEESKMRDRPVGVTIIAVIVILLGMISACSGLVGFAQFSAGFLGTVLGLGGSLTLSFIFTIVWGLAALLVGWGLWRMKKWAWMAAVIVLAVKLLFAVFALIGPANFDFLGTIVSLLILVYLATTNVRLSFIE